VGRIVLYDEEKDMYIVEVFEDAQLSRLKKLRVPRASVTL
jgi:hypothetical protein